MGRGRIFLFATEGVSKQLSFRMNFANDALHSNMQAECGVNDDVESTMLPKGYLGPMVWNQNPDLISCNSL